MPLRHLPYDRRIPPGRLDQDVAGLVGDHGVKAAHNSSQAYGLLRIGYHEIFGGELALNAVERLQSLARPRVTNDQPMSFEQVEIENVRGLTHLPQNVIGSVDGVVNRALIEQPKSVRDLLGRRLDLHVAQYPRSEARADTSVFHGDFNSANPRRRRQVRNDGLERQVVERGGFAGNAVMI